MSSEKVTSAENQQGRLENKIDFEAIEAILREEHEHQVDRISLCYSRNPNRDTMSLSQSIAFDKDKAILDTIEHITDSIEKATGLKLKIGRNSEKDRE